MVVAVTNHTAHFVEWDLPLAKGRQYQSLYLELHREVKMRRAGAGLVEAGAWERVTGGGWQ